MNHLQAVNTSAPERYLLEEMSELERHAFEDHYFSCADCAEDVRLGALMREGAKAGLMDAPVVSLAGAKAARARSVWRPSVFIPWAAAAMLALVAGAQSLMLGPAQNRLMQPLALAPITLRQASRGAEPVVPLPAGAAAITLAVIVDASRGPQLEYDVRAIGGKSVASGHVAAPQAGGPLLLLIPAWTLTPAGHYILSIHRASDGDIPDEYRFAVKAE
jgi:hypothetical protein